MTYIAGLGSKDNSIVGTVRRDVQGPFYGAGVVSSANLLGASVRKNGSSVAHVVLLVDHNTERVVQATISAADGSWQFNNVRADRLYYVRVKDETKQLNGAVIDWVQPTIP